MGLKRVKIIKPARPLLFLDTFAWKAILTDSACKDVLELLNSNCNCNKIVLPITNFIEGELASHGICNSVKKIAKNAVVFIPTGRITFNQLLAMFIGFYEKLEEVELDWEYSIGESGLVKYYTDGLKENLDNFSIELNKIRAYSLKFNKDKRKTITYSSIRKLHSNLWTMLLRALKQRDFFNLSSDDYKKFFKSDYFNKSPAIEIQIYMTAMLLNTRDIKTNDIVDIYSISEVAPYSSLTIIDKDQHRRLLSLAKLSSQFGNLLENVVIASRKSAFEILREFLTWNLSRK